MSELKYVLADAFNRSECPILDPSNAEATRSCLLELATGYADALFSCAMFPGNMFLVISAFSSMHTSGLVRHRAHGR